MPKIGNKRAGNTSVSKTKSARGSSSGVASEVYKSQSSSKVRKGGYINKTASPTHEQIEERAKLIWRQNGCPSGQDQENWYEAEAQLKRELAKE